MISNRWLELEETLGKSFQCSLFADKKPSLLLPCPKPTRKVFCFMYWSSSSFKGMQGSWVSCHPINTVQPVRVSLALLKKRELETDRKKSIFRRAGEVFFFSLQLAVSKCYPTASQLPRAVPHTPQCQHLHTHCCSSLSSPHPLHIISTETLGCTLPSTEIAHTSRINKHIIFHTLIAQ